MTFAEVCGVIDHITYKPGWKSAARMPDLNERDILHLTLAYASLDARPDLAGKRIELTNAGASSTTPTIRRGPGGPDLPPIHIPS